MPKSILLKRASTKLNIQLKSLEVKEHLVEKTASVIKLQYNFPNHKRL